MRACATGFFPVVGGRGCLWGWGEATLEWHTNAVVGALNDLEPLQCLGLRAIGRAREGSYFPDWLLQPRRRAEQAFVSVIADAYLAGVSTRRVERLVQQLGVERMSKSQVSRLAKSLDQIVEDFRTRPLDGAPYAYVTLDALEVK